jgi:hypothetical protein
MAKMTRERAVKERRALKLEKKRAAAAERKARAAGIPFTEVGDGESDPALESAAPTTNGAEGSDALLDPHQADGDDGAVLGERVMPGL